MTDRSHTGPNPWRRRARPSFPLLFLLAACAGESRGTDTDTPSRNLQVEIGVLPGAGSVLTFDGVRIEVHSDVLLEIPMRFSFVQITSDERRTVVSSHEGPDVLIDGEVLDVVEGHLRIGDREYGVVTPDDEVQITGGGVSVNGVSRPAEDR